jgi:hypothetical protein
LEPASKLKAKEAQEAASKKKGPKGKKGKKWKDLYLNQFEVIQWFKHIIVI